MENTLNPDFEESDGVSQRLDEPDPKEELESVDLVYIDDEWTDVYPM